MFLFSFSKKKKKKNGGEVGTVCFILVSVLCSRGDEIFQFLFHKLLETSMWYHHQHYQFVKLVIFCSTTLYVKKLQAIFIVIITP